MAVAKFSWMLFDADGVLQTVAPHWLDDLTRLGGQDFVVELFVREQEALTGELDFAEITQRVLDKFGLAAAVDQVMACAHEIVVDRAMLAAVSRLRESGVRCALATNQQNVRAAYMRAHLPYADLFDAAFYSCEVGLAKPDPAYFATVAERVDAVPEQILFVDDREENVLAARSIGITAEVFPHLGGVAALVSILRHHGLA